jgi:Ca-activated chloride channel family protein
MLAVVAAIVALCAFLDRVAANRGRANALASSNLTFVVGAVGKRTPIDAALFWTWICGIGLASFALCGPQFALALPVPDAAVILVLDTSGSMAAGDVSPTRAAAVRDAASVFIHAVPAGTRVGIVSFSSNATVLSPLTADLAQLGNALDRMPAPGGATAIGDALALAATQFDTSGRRAIVLVTDGVANRGLDPTAAAERIGADGIAIDAIGIGTAASGAPIPGTLETADLDEDALRAIAADGHGRYVRAGDAGALKSDFRASASDFVWRRQHVDGSLACALLGAALTVAATLCRAFVGKYP